MQFDPTEKRRVPRFPIEAGAVVEVTKNGRIARAKTINMSELGVLLQFEEPHQLVVGDRVSCQFMVAHETDKLLPYWGVGYVVRVEDRCAAVDFKGGGFVPLDPEGGTP